MELVSSVNYDQNKKLLAECFGEVVSNDLISDGVYYLREEQLLSRNLQGYALNGGPINTFNADGSTEGIISHTNTTPVEDYLVDSQYQSIFNISTLNTSAIYGVNGSRLIGKMSQYNSHPKTRASNKAIPKIIAHNVSQLNEIIQSVRETYTNKSIFFRGQNQHYSLNRSATTNKLFYGKESIDELSLPTAASRTNYDFDSFIAKLQLQLQGMIYSSFDNKSFAELDAVWPLWGPFNPFVDSALDEKHEKFLRLFYSWEWDLLAMAIGQHYGIPTHGLDITDDLKVALWFATNKLYSYKEDGKEYLWYKPLNRTISHTTDDLPVLYIVATNNDFKKDLDQVSYINLEARRPVRQNAFLHYGGWGLQKNLCAQDVVAAIFLAPDFNVDSEITAEWLFPSANEDPVYKMLLELKDSARKLGINDYDHISEFKPELGN